MLMNQGELKKKVASNFGRSARQYDELAKIQKVIATRGCQFLSPRKGRLLDIGCGTGTITQHLCEFSDNVVGLDISCGMIEQAVSYSHNGNIQWIIADAEHLPFQSSSFEQVFSSMALQWCMPVEYALEEIYRVLKPKGVASVNLMAENSFFELSESFNNIGDISPVNSFVKVKQLKQALSNRGIPVNLTVETVVDWYFDLFALLRSVSGIGAGTRLVSSDSVTLTRSKFQLLAQNYMKYYVKGKGFPLSYNIVYIQVLK